MVDLVGGALHTVRQPIELVFGIIAKHTTHVVEPWPGLGRIAGDDRWTSIEIEAHHTLVLDPSAFRDQLVFDDHWHTWRPCHLLDRMIAVQPGAGRDNLWLALIVEYRIAVRIDKLLPPDAGVDAARGPHLARRHKDVAVHWHVGMKIIERDADLIAVVIRHLPWLCAPRLRAALNGGEHRCCAVFGHEAALFCSGEEALAHHVLVKAAAGHQRKRLKAAVFSALLRPLSFGMAASAAHSSLSAQR